MEPLRRSQHQVVGVIDLARRGWKVNPVYRAALRFGRGLREFGVPSLDMRVDRNAIRVPYRFVTSIDGPVPEDWPRSMGPDVTVAYSMSLLLMPDIFARPPRGATNLQPPVAVSAASTLGCVAYIVVSSWAVARRGHRQEVSTQ